ncbi:uncharacterized protein [Macaca fascicularis]|uniref:uncharacterized protein n=1 Tax=Macaca fascicularis TaxID=9541 RepID=UPI0032B02CCA
MWMRMPFTEYQRASSQVTVWDSTSAKSAMNCGLELEVKCEETEVGGGHREPGRATGSPEPQRYRHSLPSHLVSLSWPQEASFPAHSLVGHSDSLGLQPYLKLRVACSQGAGFLFVWQPGVWSAGAGSSTGSAQRLVWRPKVQPLGDENAFARGHCDVSLGPTPRLCYSLSLVLLSKTLETLLIPARRRCESSAWTLLARGIVTYLWAHQLFDVTLLFFLGFLHRRDCGITLGPAPRGIMKYFFIHPLGDVPLLFCPGPAKKKGDCNKSLDPEPR